MINKKRFDKKALAVFISGVVMYLAVVLPDMIQYDGILMFNADYLQQTIPFTYSMYDHYRGLEFGWDMSTGLGCDYLTSYAFYGLFSPFTFLFLPLPRDILIYALPFITAVKYGTGSLFAYLYIKRFVNNANYAVIGGMVYMFSSFTAYNQIFHFTDPVALFPLLLIAMDELCLNGRRCVFALTVLLMALTNYYFFFGQAVFAVIYFICRYVDRDIRATLKRFLRVLTEAVIGTLMSCAALIPVMYAILNSPKATGFMEVSDMFLYGDIFKYLHILQSFFSVPDGFYLNTIFPELDQYYPCGMIGGSVAAYIPFFSAAGVISYFLSVKGATWEKKLLAVCAVFAFVPILNQSFSAFNSAFYARWYYMPMLVAAMVSVRAVEQGIRFRTGIIINAAAVAAMGIYAVCGGWEFLEKKAIANASFNRPLAVIYLVIAAVSLAVLAIAARSRRDKEFIPKIYIFSYICIYMCYGIMTFFNLMNFKTDDKRIVADLYAVGEELPECVGKNDRISVPPQPRNYQMMWGCESVSYFNSLHDPGFYEFLSSSDMRFTNSVFDNISIKTKELAELSSVKYYFSIGDGEEEYGWLREAARFGCYVIYEDDDYIPMGFTYDRMLSRLAFDSITNGDEKRRAYMAYLITDEPDKLSDVLPLCDDTYTPVSEDEYQLLKKAHRSECARDTQITSDSVTSEITLGMGNVVFYSISYNKGWRAFVDGEETEVFKVNNGLIGVKVPEGAHTIRLQYKTPWLDAGIAVSAFGAAAFALYAVVCRVTKRRAEKEPAVSP